ncbi:MAG: HAMP domain-containing protein [Betaproteobacteria bacterium]|nr:HAMP domain-containing protein [Betaproteobacteria bacterium]
MLPLSLALICSALVVYKLASDFVTEAYDRALYDSALDLSRRLRLRDGRLTVDLPPAAADMLEIDDIDRVYYAVRNDDGNLVGGAADLPRPQPSENRRPDYYYARYLGQGMRLVALRVPYDPDNETMFAQVIVGETLIRRRLLAEEILVAVALSQLVLIAMICISVYLGVGHGLLPLGRLRAQIEARSHRDLTPLDEPRTPREVRPLVHAINELLQRLQRAIVSQQRFIADAAHQLRTPLAGLRTHAELALREQDLAGVRERVRALMHATDRSARLAHQLLALALAEPEASATAPMSAVDLVAIARDVTAEWVPQALAHQLDLGLAAAAGSLRIRGNAVLLRELVVNLVDNAICYTQPGGQITVDVQHDAATVTLSVEDDGPGIPPGDRERVFERFQRLAENRTEGCGLGLAIVREIAQAHAAEVRIGDGASGKGTRVSIRFARIDAGNSGALTRQTAAASGPG